MSERRFQYSFLLYLVPTLLLTMSLGKIIDSSRPTSAEISSSDYFKTASGDFETSFKIESLYFPSKVAGYQIYPINQNHSGEFLGAQLIAFVGERITNNPKEWERGIKVFKKCASDENIRHNLRGLCQAQLNKYCQKINGGNGCG